MAEPKDKNSQKWREWYLRHNGVDTEAIRIALKNGLNPEILRKYLEDLKGEEN